MSISKKKRFGIFERDNFCCQYCGKRPPDIILHVDHMVSKKDGGNDDNDNLITSCKDCNLGKSSKTVDVKKLKQSSWKKRTKELNEKMLQLEAYYDFLKAKEATSIAELQIFQRQWEDCSDQENSLTDKGLRNIKTLLNKYSMEMILDAIRITWETDYVEPNEKFRYMCGILKHLNQTDYE